KSCSVCKWSFSSCARSSSPGGNGRRPWVTIARPLLSTTQPGRAPAGQLARGDSTPLDSRLATRALLPSAECGAADDAVGDVADDLLEQPARCDVAGEATGADCRVETVGQEEDRPQDGVLGQGEQEPLAPAGAGHAVAYAGEGQAERDAVGEVHQRAQGAPSDLSAGDHSRQEPQIVGRYTQGADVRGLGEEVGRAGSEAPGDGARDRHRLRTLGPAHVSAGPRRWPARRWVVGA